MKAKVLDLALIASFLILTLIIGFNVSGCQKQSQSIKASISCDEDYDDLEITLVDVSSGEARELEPTSSGEVDFGELEAGEYRLEVKAFQEGQDQPTLDYRNTFSIPMNNPSSLLALPAAPEIANTTFDNQQSQRTLLVDVAYPTECFKGNYVPTVYVGSDSADLRHEENKQEIEATSSPSRITIPLDNVNAFIAIDWSLQGQGQSIELKGQVFSVNAIEGNYAFLEYNQLTVLDMEDVDTYFLEAEIESGEYYVLDIYDEANGPYTSSQLVFNCENYFFENRATYPKGCRTVIKGQQDGALTISVNRSVEAVTGTFAAKISKLDVSNPLELDQDTSIQFENQAQTIIARKSFGAGNHTITTALDNANSNTLIFYSAFIEADQDGSDQLDPLAVQIGSTVVGSTSNINQSISLDEPSEVLIIASSSYYGEGNTLNIQFD